LQAVISTYALPFLPKSHIFLSISCEHAALTLVADRVPRMLFGVRVIVSMLIYE
jgi:hypothetical protein